MTAGEPKQGVQAALAATETAAATDPAAVAEAVEARSPAQLPLVVVADLDGDDSEATAVDPAAVAGAPARRGPGRPPGAHNRRTVELIDYMTALGYRMPPLVLAETYSRPVGELAKELGISKGEAFKLQLAAAQALLPYTAQKLPLAIQIDSRGRMQLIIERPGSPDAAAGKTVAGWQGDTLVIDGEAVAEQADELGALAPESDGK